MHDQLATGRKIRVLTVADPRFSYRAENVVETHERICVERGYPKTIRVDQGSEFVSRDLDLWAYTKGVTLDFSRTGKLTDNAFWLIGHILPDRLVEVGLVAASLAAPVAKPHTERWRLRHLLSCF